MFIAIDKLTEIISWKEIVESYFLNDINLYKKIFKKL